MCGEMYNPDTVIVEPTIYGVAAAGEVTSTRGRGGRRYGTSGYPYTEERKVGADICGDTGVLGFWDPIRICIFGIHAVDTGTAYY